MDVQALTCNYVLNPVGVETPNPRLSWQLASSKRNQCQSAFRILVARSVENLNRDQGDLWDSGRVVSEQSIHVVYAGKALASRTSAYWKVQVWDGDQNPSFWSANARFEMGLLAASDWHGHWIGSPAGATDGDRWVPAPLLRTAFVLDQPVLRARAYVSGLGYYEFHLNGSKVGDEVLSPGFTRFDRTVLYRVFDVAEGLRLGENVIGMMLGNGWYNAHAVDVWRYHAADWRDQPKCLVQLEITLADGQEVTVLSGPQWKTVAGPVVFDGLRNGEHYDARKEVPGWDAPGFQDQSWQNVRLLRSPGGVMRSEQMPPIRVVRRVLPVARHTVRPRAFVFDFGENVSGWAAIRVRGPEGSEVCLKYGESLGSDGSVDTERMRRDIKIGQFQTDRYTLKGEGVEVFEPHFVYHGFRYVEVEGWPSADLDSVAIVAHVVHTDLESRGSFRSSNCLLNRIQLAARNSTLTNYHSIPTDCPHREKNGWTGDAALSAEQVLLNFNPATAYAKWMQDFKDAQRPSGQLPGIVPSSGWGYNWGSGPAWDSAMFLIPWYVYEYDGDPSLLADMYAPMKAYLEFAGSMAVDGVVSFGLGDWCPPIGRGGQHECPTAITDTACVYVMANVMAKAATILGHGDDVTRYQKLAVHYRHVFRQRFMDEGQGTMKSGGQTALATAVYQGLADKDEASRLIEA